MLARAESGSGRFGHPVENALRRRGPDARDELHEAKARDPVARILREPQQGQHVLDVRAVEKFEAAEFDEGNVAAGELDFQVAAVDGRPEQNRLLLQDRAAFAVLQHAFNDIAGLVGLIAHTDQLRPLGRLAFRPEVLGEALGRQIDDAIGGGEDRLRRPIVPVERDDIGGRAEALRKVEDVANGRGAKGIDGLRVVADDRKASSRRA